MWQNFTIPSPVSYTHLFENCEFEYDGEVSHRDLRSGRVLMMGEEIGIIVAAADVATGRVDFMPQEP